MDENGFPSEIDPVNVAENLTSSVAPENPISSTNDEYPMPSNNNENPMSHGTAESFVPSNRPTTPTQPVLAETALTPTHDSLHDEPVSAVKKPLSSFTGPKTTPLMQKLGESLLSAGSKKKAKTRPQKAVKSEQKDENTPGSEKKASSKRLDKATAIDKLVSLSPRRQRCPIFSLLILLYLESSRDVQELR